jgi:serine/threonine protein kinase
MDEEVFLKRAIAKSLITPEQAQEALKAKDGMVRSGKPDAKIWEVLVLKRFLTREQTDSLLGTPRTKRFSFGPFTIISKLGEGGMGIVYLAKKAESGEPVALKVLPQRLSKDGTYAERFMREA